MKLLRILGQGRGGGGGVERVGVEVENLFESNKQEVENQENAQTLGFSIEFEKKWKQQNLAITNTNIMILHIAIQVRKITMKALFTKMILK